MEPVLLYKMGKQGLRGAKRLAQGHTVVGRGGWRPPAVIPGARHFSLFPSRPGLAGAGGAVAKTGIREVRRGSVDTRHAGRLCKSSSQPHCPRGASWGSHTGHQTREVGPGPPAHLGALSKR